MWRRRNPGSTGAEGDSCGCSAAIVSFLVWASRNADRDPVRPPSRGGVIGHLMTEAGR